MMGKSAVTETIGMSRRPTVARAKNARGAVRIAAVVVGLLIAGLPGVVSAPAAQNVIEFEVFSTTREAGGHPDLGASIRLENAGEPEVAKNLLVNMPEGIFGNPGAILKCRSADFVLNRCAPATQVGVISIIANYEGDTNFVLGSAPLYNMETISEEESARMSFVVPTVNVPVAMPIELRTESDYGIRMSINAISQTVALAYANLQVWGFPAHADHDPQRFYPGKPGEPPGCPGTLGTECLTSPYPEAGIGVRAFLNNPSVCTGASLPVRVDVTTYQDPTPSVKESAYPPTIECEGQKFDPAFQLDLTTDETDSPSGLDIKLKAAQFVEGVTPTQSNLRSGVLTLPPGLTINPDAADGQTSCSDADANFGTNLPGECPDNAKVGTVDVRSPAIDGPLLGSIYLGEPKPGNQYRAFLIFDGFGIHAKLIAAFHPDPVTGQVTMSITDLPQVPFEEFNLHLFASDRGLMATPTHCTFYRADAVLTPWNDVLAPQNASPVISLGKGPNGKPCPGQTRPFNPRLVAGTSNPVAGRFSSFILKLDRDDGDQILGDLNFRMPPGFTGYLRGITYCPEHAIAAAALNPGRDERDNPSCPASSQIGTTNVAAGPGEHPFHAVGRMYLAGPLKGAPLSLAAVTPALAGPYDYGTQVVRVALHVDPRTAQVYAVSDTVPSIIGGIPIRMRTIQVSIDRPEFTINPTNCSAYTVDSQGIGDQGTVADFSSYFQAVNCATLPFEPRMTIRQLGKRKQTKRSRNPRLRFDLWTRGGDANLKSVAVTLPKAFAIDQRHLGNICSKAQLEAELCAGRQPIGSAWVKTPLLDEPLKGPAYAVSGFGKLPRVAFILAGQVTIIPQAESSSVRGGQLRTVVPVIPDAPVGHFRLTLLGGGNGYLVNTRDLCVSKTVTGVQFIGQNGKRRNRRVRVRTSCGGKRQAKRRGHSRLER
jgi:hypothetical protein